MTSPDESGTPAKSRILVVLEPHPESARLLRVGKRKAELEALDWEVLLIETPRWQQGFKKQDKEQLLNLENQARQMGAIITRKRSHSLLRSVLEVVRERQQEGIKLCSVKVGLLHRTSNWLGVKAPLYKELQRHIPSSIRVSAIPLGVTTRKPYPFMHLLHVRGREILFSLLSVAAAVAFIEILDYFLPDTIGSHNRNKTIILMTACAFASGRYGLIAGLIASVASFLALSMFYVMPYHSLLIDNRTDAANLALFVMAAFIISLLGSRDYGDRLALSKRSARFHFLLQIHRLVLNKESTAEAVATLEEELKELLDMEVVFFLPNSIDERRLETILPRDLRLNISDEKALRICWEESKTSGIGTPFEPEGGRWRFEPMVTAQDEIGVLGVKVNNTFNLDEDIAQLISGIADQTALIVERLQVGQQAEKNKIHAEREKLRVMLLSSVSHDLKTPLASIIGSLSVFRSMDTSLAPEHRLTLINTAIDEAQRLDSFITNILDMTRIESGQIELKSEWVSPEELVKDATKRLREKLRGHQLRILPSTDRVMVKMDAMMTGQVLQNLLDNAAKYTTHGTEVEINWQILTDGTFSLSIRDHGAGIPEAKLEKIFDKYARIKRQDSQVAGTGLGLAIARAVMRAQGGDIVASNHEEGGAVFTLTLPESKTLNNTQAA